MTKPLDPIEATTATHPAFIPDQHAQCQNCDATLHGSYCHACGQHAHNPLRSFRHAVEDVFESFWHVDGRIFRTVRDLLVPGKVSREYLDGHRVRYIPPLRLYVVLSLLTFFVAHFVAAGLKPDELIRVNDDGRAGAIALATTVEEVEQARAKALAELDLDTGEAGDVAVARMALATSREAINRAADRRIAELGGQPVGTPAQATPAAPPPATHEDGPWQAWERNARANLDEFASDGRVFVERLIQHVPTTLFVLVPLFALVLRGVYLRRPMGYLEHLVVALYSHGFLMLVALAWMLLLLLDRAIGSTLLGGIAGSVMPLLVMAYLLLSQKRVYGSGWPATVLAWGVTGVVYSVLAAFALTAAVAMSFLLRG